MTPPARQLWILYDARAYGDPDDAVVYCTARSLKEARRDKRTMFPDAAIYVYDEDGNQLVNGRLVE